MMNNAAAESFVVHVARTEAEKSAIYRLRYDVYIAEQRKQYVADHERGLLRDDRDEDADHLCILGAGRVTAAIRAHFGGESPHPQLPLASIERASQRDTVFLSRLVVERSRRGGVVTPALFRAVYRHAVENGARRALTWCVPALAPLYERVGFRRYAPSFHDPVVGEMVPLFFDCEDTAYLREIRSGLAPIAEMYFGRKSLCA